MGRQSNAPHYRWEQLALGGMRWVGGVEEWQEYVVMIRNLGGQRWGMSGQAGFSLSSAALRGKWVSFPTSPPPPWFSVFNDLFTHRVRTHTLQDPYQLGTGYHSNRWELRAKWHDELVFQKHHSECSRENGLRKNIGSMERDAKDNSLGQRWR